MQKQILLEIVRQNRLTSHFSFYRVTDENAGWRLNEHAASVGFIFRHIGETINLFAQMLGTPTEVRNTTIGRIDSGERYDVAESRALIARGYDVLERMVEDGREEAWLEPVDTPFFGTVSRARLFAHVLFHNSHHAGQISLTLAKGR